MREQISVEVIIAAFDQTDVGSWTSPLEHDVRVRFFVSRYDTAADCGNVGDRCLRSC